MKELQNLADSSVDWFRCSLKKSKINWDIRRPNWATATISDFRVDEISICSILWLWGTGFARSVLFFALFTWPGTLSSLVFRSVKVDFCVLGKSGFEIWFGTNWELVLLACFARTTSCICPLSRILSCNRIPVLQMQKPRRRKRSRVAVIRYQTKVNIKFTAPMPMPERCELSRVMKGNKSRNGPTFEELKVGRNRWKDKNVLTRESTFFSPENLSENRPK